MAAIHPSCDNVRDDTNMSVTSSSGLCGVGKQECYASHIL